MIYDPQRHHRRSIRLKGYDYSRAGAYFVTICASDRACVFGEVVDGEMRLNTVGKIVADSWQWLAEQYDYVELDAWVVMPNHLHGVIVIAGDGQSGAQRDPAGGAWIMGQGGACTAPTDGRRRDRMDDGRAAPTSETGIAPAGQRKPLGRLVGAFKTVSAKQINLVRQTPGAQVWQRNYYEHIIRDEVSLNRIRQYIANNPARWAYDRENPFAMQPEPEDT